MRSLLCRPTMATNDPPWSIPGEPSKLFMSAPGRAALELEFAEGHAHQRRLPCRSGPNADPNGRRTEIVAASIRVVGSPKGKLQAWRFTGHAAPADPPRSACRAGYGGAAGVDSARPAGAVLTVGTTKSHALRDLKAGRLLRRTGSPHTRARIRPPRCRRPPNSPGTSGAAGSPSPS
jgi:hypothetical protein